MRKLSKTLLIALGLVAPLTAVPVLNVNSEKQTQELKEIKETNEREDFASETTLKEDQYGVPQILGGSEVYTIWKPKLTQNGPNDFTGVIEFEILDAAYKMYFNNQVTNTNPYSGIYIKFLNSSDKIILSMYPEQIKVTGIDSGKDLTGEVVSKSEGRMRAELQINKINTEPGLEPGGDYRSEMRFYIGTSDKKANTHKVMSYTEFTEGAIEADPPQITQFEAQAVTEGIKLDWTIENPDGADITSIEIFYEGTSIHKASNDQLTGSFTHEAGERGKEYKLVVTTSDTDPSEATTLVKAEAPAPTLKLFENDVDKNEVFVAINDKTIGSTESMDYGEGRLVDATGNVKAKTEHKTHSSEPNYWVFGEGEGYSTLSGELFFQFTDKATGKVYTTNPLDSTSTVMTPEADVPTSVTFLEAPLPATVTLDKVEVKGEDNVDITITNNIPAHDDLITDTVIDGIDVNGADLLEENITVLDGTNPQGNGTYKVNVSGLTAGTVYSDWTFTTKTNAGDIVTEVTEFTTIKSAAVPTVAIEAVAKDQVSADVTYTINVPTGDAATTDTVVDSATLTGTGITEPINLTADNKEHTVTIDGLKAATDYTWTYTVESNAEIVTGDVSVKTLDLADPVKGTSTFGITDVNPSKTDVTLTYDLDLADETDTNLAAVITEATLTGEASSQVTTATFVEGTGQTLTLTGLEGEKAYNWDLTLKTNAGDVFEENISFETLGKDAAPAATIADTSAVTGQTTANINYTIGLTDETATTEGTVVNEVIVEDEANGIKQSFTTDSDLTAGAHTVTIDGLEGGTEYNFIITLVDNSPEDDATAKVSVKTEAKDPADETTKPVVEYTDVTPGHTDATMGVTLDNVEGDATTSDVVVKSATATITDGTSSFDGSTIDPTILGTEQTVTFDGLGINTSYTGTLTVTYDNGSGTDQTETYDIAEFTTKDAVATIDTFEAAVTSTTTADVTYKITAPEATLATVNSVTLDYNGNSVDLPTTESKSSINLEGTVALEGLTPGEATEVTLTVDYTKAGAPASEQVTETITVETPASTINDAQLVDIKKGEATFDLTESFYIENPTDDMVVTVEYTENGTNKKGIAEYVTTSDSRSNRKHTYKLGGLAATAVYTNIDIIVTYNTVDEDPIDVAYDGTVVNDENPIQTDENKDISQPEDSKKFPWWIIILLIILTLGIAGIILFFVFKKKDDKEDKGSEKKSKSKEDKKS